MNEPIEVIECQGRTPVSDVIRVAQQYFPDTSDAVRCVLSAIRAGTLNVTATKCVYSCSGRGDILDIVCPPRAIGMFALPVEVYSSTNWREPRDLMHNAATVEVWSQREGTETYIMGGLWADLESVGLWEETLTSLHVPYSDASASPAQKRDNRRGRPPNVEAWQNIAAATALCIHRLGTPFEGQERTAWLDCVMDILSTKMGDAAPSAPEPIRIAVNMAIDFIIKDDAQSKTKPIKIG